MERTASAVWSGGLKDGKGTISTQSGTLKDTQYSFGTRFENGTGTNPEELIAAAHAGCFTMALSAQLGQANLTPESLETTQVSSSRRPTPASPSRPFTWSRGPRFREPASRPLKPPPRTRKWDAPFPGCSKATRKSVLTPSWSRQMATA